MAKGDEENAQDAIIKFREAHRAAEDALAAARKAHGTAAESVHHGGSMLPSVLGVDDLFPAKEEGDAVWMI